MFDLRSDTVTRPTPAMRAAMASAEVGDAVLGDDPTVIALERRVAEVLGKAAALYMPSGTMTNEVAVRTHTEPGDEIVLEAHAHIYYYEAGGPAALSGVSCRLVEGRRGVFGGDDLRAVLRPANEHYPRTRLVCVENTHNSGGGKVWPMAALAEVASAAREAGLKTHLDGARIWNAAAAAGVDAREIAVPFDSVSVCFSKGLGAPIGSALCGESDFIARARRFRKLFGGGWRQAGIIAAGALHALEHHRDRLVEDHANARALAEGLCELPGLRLALADVETNIVLFDVTSMPAAELAGKLADAGVGVLAVGPATVRAVTNLDLTSEDIQEAIEVFRQILAV